MEWQDLSELSKLRTRMGQTDQTDGRAKTRNGAYEDGRISDNAGVTSCKCCNVFCIISCRCCIFCRLHNRLVSVSIMSYSMSHGRRSRGGRVPPEFWRGDANQIVPPCPDFIILQTFAHQKVGSKKLFARGCAKN